MEDYLTVSQYAKKIGKDVGNIRRMLAYGRLLGKKIGNQWVIPENAVYPDDSRIKSGNYRNWRKASEVRKTHPELMKSLSEMSKEIESIYGELLYKIVLYGSYARGEETSESDVDIAVILKEGKTEQMHDAMVDIVVEHELAQGVTFSVIPIEFEQYDQLKHTLPFFKNMDKDGIVLWKSITT